LLLDTRKKVDKLADQVPTAEAVLREKYGDDFPAAEALEVVSSAAERDPWTTWYLFVGHRDAVKDAKSGKVLLDFQTRMYYPSAFALSPDGRRLAVGWNDTTVLLFDVPDKK